MALRKREADSDESDRKVLLFRRSAERRLRDHRLRRRQELGADAVLLRAAGHDLRVPRAAVSGGAGERRSQHAPISAWRTPFYTDVKGMVLVTIEVSVAKTMLGRWLPVNKLVGIAIGLALGLVAEKITEDMLASAGVDPRIVRVAGAIVGAVVS